MFRGFGGEEGYIHEKMRQHGGRVLCLPWLRWGHRFGRANGVPYRVSVEDKLRNYLLGYDELGLDLTPVLEHFAEHVPAERVIAVAEQTFLADLATPLGKGMTGRPKQGKSGTSGKKRKKRGKKATRKDNR
jgi:hypothetical protein